MRLVLSVLLVAFLSINLHGQPNNPKKPAGKVDPFAALQGLMGGKPGLVQKGGAFAPGGFMGKLPGGGFGIAGPGGGIGFQPGGGIGVGAPGGGFGFQPGGGFGIGAPGGGIGFQPGGGFGVGAPGGGFGFQPGGGFGIGAPGGGIGFQPGGGFGIGAPGGGFGFQPGGGFGIGAPGGGIGFQPGGGFGIGAPGGGLFGNIPGFNPQVPMNGVQNQPKFQAKPTGKKPPTPEQIKKRKVRGLVVRFLRFDRNNDGKLQLKELPIKTRSLIQKADSNGDQSVDREELRRFFEAGGRTF